MPNPDDSYLGILLEEIKDQNKAVIEAVGSMQTHVAKIAGIETDVAELKYDMKVVKAVLAETASLSAYKTAY